LITAWLAVFLTQVEAQTADKQKQALIGEWRSGVWPGHHGDTSTLIIHEIDAAKAKARCTYITYQKDLGKSEYEILADYFPGQTQNLSLRKRRVIIRVFLKIKYWRYLLSGKFGAFPCRMPQKWKNTRKNELKD